jgi:hypothetical protein
MQPLQLGEIRMEVFSKPRNLRTTACKHLNLTALPGSAGKLKCRHCHLTITADELGDGPCPECFERSGDGHYDFDEVEAAGAGTAKYRCDECGAIIAS